LRRLFNLTDEELKQKDPDPLEEELSQLKSRVSELEQLAAQKDKELSAKDERTLALEQVIADKDNEIASLKQSVAESEEQLNQMTEHLSQAVSNYKSMVIEANPEVPPELITGDTIDAVNDSLAKAKTLVNKVRQGLEAEVIKARVPAGAPVRTLPDFSALSAREKIQYAIGGNK
jgi:predicted RNase H-like nuclease (RuvC/YqgF family)